MIKEFGKLVSFMMGEEKYILLQKLAEKQKTTVSVLIRKAIDYFLEKNAR